jgi:hypothetical protein
MPELPRRLELILGTETQAQTANWDWISVCKLEAPILNFTISDILDEEFHGQVKSVLKFWHDFDVENLARIKNGTKTRWLPAFFVYIGSPRRILSLDGAENFLASFDCCFGDLPVGISDCQLRNSVIHKVRV